MPDLRKTLKTRLKDARRIAVLGIGSDLRGDDAAGMLVASSMEKRLKKAPKRVTFRAFLGSTAPENLTGEIRRFKPSHLVLIDTVEMGEAPGTILLLKPEDIGRGVSFSTHKMPAKVLVAYLLKSLRCKVTIIGIQPASLEFGRPPSKDVKEAAGEVASALVDAAHKSRKGLTNKKAA